MNIPRILDPGTFGHIGDIESENFELKQCRQISGFREIAKGDEDVLLALLDYFGTGTAYAAGALAYDHNSLFSGNGRSRAERSIRMQ